MLMLFDEQNLRLKIIIKCPEPFDSEFERNSVAENDLTI